jgi:type VI secretion system secreted protein VgrG
MQMSDVTSFFGLQNSRLFSIDTPLSGQSQLLVSDFSCSDELSQLFNIEVGLVSQDATIAETTDRPANFNRIGSY